MKKIFKYPIFTLWVKPRKTIKIILDLPAKKGILLLLMILGGISTSDIPLQENSFVDLSTNWSQIYALMIILGTSRGVIYYYVGSFLILWIGRWLNGKGNLADIKKVMAWSNIPDVFYLFILLIYIGLFGKFIFYSEPPLFNQFDYLAYLVFNFITIILMIWRSIIFIIGLSEAHDFSIWKGLANSSIVFLLSTGIFYVVLIVFT